MAGAPGDDFGQESFTDARIANDADVSAVVDEVEIQQAQNAVLQLEARLVMVELETVDGRLGVQAGELEAALHGALRAGFEFPIDQGFQGLGDAKIAGRRLGQCRFQLLAHGQQVQLIESLLQYGHR